MFCPIPYPSLTRSLPKLTPLQSRRRFRPCRNQHQHFPQLFSPRGVSLFKKQLMNFQAALSGFLNRKLIDGSRTFQGIQTSSTWNSRRAALE